MPQNVTFDSGDTSKSFTFTAAHDTVDDDGESVKLSFGATLPDGVSVGTTDEATVSITDDDDPGHGEHSASARLFRGRERRLGYHQRYGERRR